MHSIPDSCTTEIPHYTLAAFLAQPFGQIGIAEKPRESARDLGWLVRVYEQSRHVVLNGLGNPA